MDAQQEDLTENNTRERDPEG